MHLRSVLPVFLLLVSFGQRAQSISTACISEKEKNLSRFHIQCTEKEKPSDNIQDPVLVKTCRFRNFESIRTGTADYKGRYSYDYELYKTDNHVKQKVRNSTLFGSDAPLVERRINKDLQQEHQKKLRDAQLKDCMERIDLHYYRIDEMGMAFTDANEIEFYIDHGIGGVCLNVGHSVLQYKLSEFVRYME